MNDNRPRHGHSQSLTLESTGTNEFDKSADRPLELPGPNRATDIDALEKGKIQPPKYLHSIS